jgi:nitrile hydratase
VLQEFGTELDEDVQVRVIDSSADYRYLVLPKRPIGTDGMSEEDLAKLITQESMIGVGLALTPEQVSAS